MRSFGVRLAAPDAYPTLGFDSRVGEYLVGGNSDRGDELVPYLRRLRAVGRPRGAVHVVSVPELYRPPAGAVVPQPRGNRYLIPVSESTNDEHLRSRAFVGTLGRDLRLRRLRQISCAPQAVGASIAYSRTAARFIGVRVEGEPTDRSSVRQSGDVFARWL